MVSQRSVSCTMSKYKLILPIQGITSFLDPTKFISEISVSIPII